MKQNVVLDLDHTLICALSADEERADHAVKFDYFDWKDMDGEFKIFARPGLDVFLDFLFANFNVSVWTAASQTYCSFIVQHFILKPGRKLDYILFSHHCDESRRINGSHKDLRSLVRDFCLPSSYALDNTVIIDDSVEVNETQPGSCVPVRPFKFCDADSELDNVLLKTITPALKDRLCKD